MVFTPTVVTTTNYIDAVPRNMYALVDEYKISNSSVIFQNKEGAPAYPQHVIFIPDYTSSKRTITSKKDIYFSVAIQFNATPEQSWRKCNEMFSAIHNGLETEDAKLTTARMEYLSHNIVDSSAININGQQIYSIEVDFNFRLLL